MALASQFFHNYHKTEGRERNATNFYCSHGEKKKKKRVGKKKKGVLFTGGVLQNHFNM